MPIYFPSVVSGITPPAPGWAMGDINVDFQRWRTLGPNEILLMGDRVTIGEILPSAISSDQDNPRDVQLWRTGRPPAGFVVYGWRRSTVTIVSVSGITAWRRLNENGSDFSERDYIASGLVHIPTVYEYRQNIGTSFEEGNFPEIPPLKRDFPKSIHSEPLPLP